MIELLKKMEKEKNINLNDGIREIPDEDDTILAISTFIEDNSINKVLDSYEFTLESDAIPTQAVKNYLKEIRSSKFIEGLEINLANFVKLAYIECIKRYRYGIDFVELMQEAQIWTFLFYTRYYEKLESKKNIKAIFSTYIEIKALKYQYEQAYEQFSYKMNLLLYAKIKDRLENNEQLEDILDELNIELDYYERLEDFASAYSIDVDELEVEEKTKHVIEIFENDSKTFMFSYIEASLLIDYLGLENKKYSSSDLEKKYGKEYKNKLTNVLVKIEEDTLFYDNE